MIQYNIFPGGKKKIVTFSYDDGSHEDGRLVQLFDKYSLRATFHLCSGSYGKYSAEEKKALADRYHGHEIACHTVHHGWPSRMPDVSVINEVLFDRLALEEIAGYPVIGMSYPCGDYDDRSVSVMESCGIAYSRTVNATGAFGLPTDFMRWHPSCHHNGAKDCIQRFLDGIDSIWSGPLLYIWGHSHEFRSEEQWAAFEENLQAIAGHDKIWYATSGEIYRYMTAQRRLEISADEKMIYNPSAIPVYVEKNSWQVICIGPGETWREQQ